MRQAATVWGRGHLIVVLTGVVLAGICLLVGLVLAVRSVVVRPPIDAAETAQPVPLPGDTAQRRDTLAAQPMLPVSAADATAGYPAATPGPTIPIPDSTRIGPAKVPSGFPHTPQGAIGQLAAIEIAVLTEMSIARTNEIYLAWTAPHANPIEDWPMTRNVQAFLGATSMGQTLEHGASVTVTPVAAQTKATDGPDWTIACVLVDVRAVVASEARMAYGYCERMSWDGRRWVIAAGEFPALAPSTWPGTDLAFQAGWRTWLPVGR